MVDVTLETTSCVTVAVWVVLRLSGLSVYDVSVTVWVKIPLLPGTVVRIIWVWVSVM